MQVTIPSRFRGPSRSGNGGYTSGLLAAALQGAVEITLKKPPPLEVPLTIAVEGDGASLREGDDDVAIGRVAPLTMDIPDPPTFAEAVDAARRYTGFDRHPYPGCFVCGPERASDDGLRIFPGAVAGRALVAAPFTPSASLGAPGASVVEPAIVWAALDCPGYFGGMQGREASDAAVLLGKIHAEILGPVRIGVAHVVIGFPLGVEGRKIFAGTALFDDRARLVARSRQIWIAPKPA